MLQSKHCFATNQLIAQANQRSVRSRLAATNNILHWIETNGGTVSDAISREYMGENLGHGLVAKSADIPANAPLISLPMPLAITSEGAADESNWSTVMALQLLDQLDQGDDSTMLPWLQALPKYVNLPWLYWTEEEILELQDSATIEEAFRLKDMFVDVCEEYALTYTPEQLAWALSLVHSRSFIDRGLHIWVPGIDMCNHTLKPNATVRTVYSPETCQGSQATEEIAPPSSSSAEVASRFELVAGDDGIRQGDEVTISYGSWPNDVFLLFFGYVAEENPNDAAVLFADLFDLATFHQRLVADGDDDVLIQLLFDSLDNARTGFVRMVVTANGLDGRLIEAANAILQAKSIRNSLGLPMKLPEYLSKRCTEILDSYPTTLEQDAKILKQLVDNSSTEGGNIETAVRYRMSKKRMLLNTLDQLTSA